MLQGWYDLASAHWPYDPAAVQRLLPQGLRVDTCQGAAWVGLIPFHTRRIRVPRCPPLGRWSTFPETNVLTYVVTPDGRRAVWFCSLDISRIVPALVARITYGLPYCWGKMPISHGEPHTVEYTASRRWPHPGAVSRMMIQIGELIDDEDLTEVSLPTPTGDPIVLWSPGVEVRIGRPRRLTHSRPRHAPARQHEQAK